MIPKYLERLLSEPEIFRKIIYQFSLSGILKKILLNKSKDLNLNIYQIMARGQHHLPNN